MKQYKLFVFTTVYLCILQTSLLSAQQRITMQNAVKTKLPTVMSVKTNRKVLTKTDTENNSRYVQNFDDKAAFETFMVVNKNNDECTWTYDSRVKAARYNNSKTLAADDWLLSPNIKLDNKHAYMLNFKYRAGFWSYTETFEVGIGTEIDTENYKIIVPRIETAVDSFQNNETEFTVKEDGDYRIGVHAMSKADQYYLFIDDISISEKALLAAPAATSIIDIKPGQQGTLTTDISFTTPTKAYDGSRIESLTKVEIYRNAKLITTFENPRPNVQLHYTDNSPTQGINQYSIIAYNNVGKGLAAVKETFVGIDIPAPPKDIILKESDNRITLAWKTPTEGAHNGYFDKSTLTYDVMRLPDSVTIATKVTACSIKDNVKSHAGYSYIVTAYNKNGKGLSATSNIVAFGSMEPIPFISNLLTKDEFRRWTVIDNNHDGMSWSFHDGTSRTFYDRSEKAADDWLVSPPLKFSKGKKYQLRYTYSSANWIDPSTHKPVMEKMKVFYGTQATPEKLTTLIKDLGEFHTASEHFYYGKEIFTPNETYGHIAFYACSDALKGQIYLKDISLREYSETDLSIKKLNGSVTANCNVEQPFIVTVGNEGSSTVSNYKIELFDANSKEVLGTADGIAIAPDTVKTVTVMWVPKTKGEINVSARIVLVGDTYPADNILDTPVKVKVADADAEKWITLNAIDNYGWVMPFYLISPYAQSQCLYLENEIRKKNIDIVALQLKYNGKNELAYTFPAKISMKATNRTNTRAENSGYLGHFEQTDWTTVYDGNITIEGVGDNKELKIVFDEPFKYTDGNILFKFEAFSGDNPIEEAQHPEWLFDMPKGDAHSARFDGKTEDINEEDILISEYIPFLMLEYTEKNSAGIFSVDNDLVKITRHNNVINTSTVCDLLEIINISGTTITKVQNTNRINLVTIPSGIYLLKVKKGGVIRTMKILKQ